MWTLAFKMKNYILRAKTLFNAQSFQINGGRLWKLSQSGEMFFFQKPFFKDLGYYIHYAFSDTHTASHLSFLELLLQIYPSKTFTENLDSKASSIETLLA